MLTKMTDPKPVATATVPSNTTPQSKVDVPASLPIKLKIRLFPANTTAKLEKKKPDLSKKLNGLKIIFGKVQAGEFVPFDDKIRGTPSLTAVEYYRTTEGIFDVPTAAELGALRDAKRRMDQKVIHTTDKGKEAKDKEEKEKAKVQFEALSSVWTCVGKDDVPFGYHDIPLNVAVPKGTTVGVCINVDAKKKFRQYPLWQVTADANDIVIDVYETYGKELGLDDGVKHALTRNEGTDDSVKLVDYYKARLTGDLWMRSTHPFTAADVDAMDPSRASEAMRTALKKIYAADFSVEKNSFFIDVPRGKDEKDAASVRLIWDASSHQN